MKGRFVLAGTVIGVIMLALLNSAFLLVFYHFGFIIRYIRDWSYLILLIFVLLYPIAGVLIAAMLSDKWKKVFLYINLLWILIDAYYMLLNLTNYADPVGLRPTYVDCIFYFGLIGKIVFLFVYRFGEFFGKITLASGSTVKVDGKKMTVLGGGLMFAAAAFYGGLKLGENGWLISIVVAVCCVFVSYVLYFLFDRIIEEPDKNALLLIVLRKPGVLMNTAKMGTGLKITVMVLYMFLSVLQLLLLSSIYALMLPYDERMSRVPIFWAVSGFTVAFWYFLSMLVMFIAKIVKGNIGRKAGGIFVKAAFAGTTGEFPPISLILPPFIMQTAASVIETYTEVYYRQLHGTYYGLALDALCFGTVFVSVLWIICLFKPPKLKGLYFRIISVFIAVAIGLGMYISAIPMKDYSEIITYGGIFMIINIILSAVMLAIFIFGGLSHKNKEVNHPPKEVR